jgi:hypothetical protein
MGKLFDLMCYRRRNLGEHLPSICKAPNHSIVKKREMEIVIIESSPNLSLTMELKIYDGEIAASTKTAEKTG